MAPDVICMDVRLPGMNGIEATRRIMEEFPTPIIVVAADLRSETINKSMEALRAGAMAVVEKPTVESVDAYKAMARSLCNQFVNLSRVKVVRQRFNGTPWKRSEVLSPPPASLAPHRFASEIEVVGVAASTGGPAAVAHLLQGLEADLSTPVLLVQHMGSEFLQGYAAWLNSLCLQTVALASNFESPQPGHVYVAPGQHHLTFEQGKMRLIRDGGKGHNHVPSGDVLFASLAASVGPRAVGVLLTGMGDDGARGLLQMREAGAHTIVQDRTTSAVYGMPAAAVALGAAQEELPIGAIAPRVAEIVARATRVKQVS
jgi:two-component system chemotaxis response regulator CheB